MIREKGVLSYFSTWITIFIGLLHIRVDGVQGF